MKNRLRVVRISCYGDCDLDLAALVADFNLSTCIAMWQAAGQRDGTLNASSMMKNVAVAGDIPASRHMHMHMRLHMLNAECRCLVFNANAAELYVLNCNVQYSCIVLITKSTVGQYAGYFVFAVAMLSNVLCNIQSPTPTVLCNLQLHAPHHTRPTPQSGSRLYFPGQYGRVTCCAGP